jgi:anti-anti-sigma regulatory factor
MAEPKFPVSMDVEGQKATLTAQGPHLETTDADEFETACGKLLDTGQPSLVVDVTAVHTIQSILIGEIAKTKIIASEAGRKFILIANRKIADIFKMILSDLVEIEVKG